VSLLTQPMEAPAVASKIPDPSKSPRNPTWGRDELILALDLYMTNPASPPRKTSPEVVALSKLLNRMSPTPGAAKFRNPNGVYMKMMNFRRFDPKFKLQGKVGLTRGGKDEQQVWKEFAEDRDHLGRVAAAIRKAVDDQQALAQAAWEDDEGTEAPEGRYLTMAHRRRERNRRLVARRKEKALKLHGTLECEVCSFNFEEVYGQRGKGFIECHHTKALEEFAKDGGKTRLDDLALLCANCHRMIHSARPWLTISELRSLLLSADATAKPQ
jgi:5-methylcytosine-specific restriction enzyme A